MPVKTSRTIVGMATTAALLSGTALAGSPAQATSSSAPGAASAQSSPGGLTADQWESIAAEAKRAGDAQSVAAATEMAKHGRGGPATYNWAAELVKRALVAALRHGGTKLPGPLSKWSSKIVGVIEDIEAIEQKPLITALMSAGIPASDAQFIAQWCVTFAGI